MDLTLAEAIAVTRAHYAAIPSYIEKPASLRYREQILDVLAKTLPSGKVSNWSPRDMDIWWQSNAIRAYAPSRRNNMLGTLRKMMELAVQCHARLDDPSVHLRRLPVRQKAVHVPSRENLRAIVETIRSQKKRASEESANFVQFLAFSGMRISEARAVTWEDVGERAILVTGGERGTKNYEHRRVPSCRICQSYYPAFGPLWREGRCGRSSRRESPWIMHACDWASSTSASTIYATSSRPPALSRALTFQP